jgi:hypothetical protein
LINYSYLRDTWETLENYNLGTREYQVREADGFELEEGPLLIGIDKNWQRHILIPVSSRANIKEDKTSGGVQIFRKKLEDQGKTNTYVDVVCLKPHLNELFSIIANEMLQQLKLNIEQPDKTCHQVLDRWRELLQAEFTGKPEISKVIGLFGELWQLREIVRLNSNAISCWVGPNGTRHDIVADTISLEVKASQTRFGRFVEIHSHDQLEPPPGGQLYLATMKLEQTNGEGESLPGLVESIVALGVNRDHLITLISRTGVTPGNLALSSDISFHVVENRIYAVTGNFPRITSESFVNGKVPPGILKLNYQIDLTNEPPVPLNIEETSDLYQKIAAGTQK